MIITIILMLLIIATIIIRPRAEAAEPDRHEPAIIVCITITSTIIIINMIITSNIFL